MTNRLWQSRGVLKLVLAATLAVSAQAATIFNVTGASFGINLDETSGAGDLSNTEFSTEGLPIFNNVIGVKGFGSTTLTVGEGGDGFFELYALMEGTGSGDDFATSEIPAEWQFTVTSSNANPVNWLLLFTVNGIDSEFNDDGTPLPGTEENDGLINVPNGSALSTWSARLSLTWEGQEGDTLTLTIPQNSIDINPGGEFTGVPEPSAFLLVVPGLALLYLGRRRVA